MDGRWKDYDPFEADYRIEANMNEAGYANGCTFFRAFQGWVSLTRSGPGKGTLRILPLLKEVTAFWMLRPFASDVPEGSFPGCYPSKTFHVLNKWHKLLVDHLVSLPDIGPGDTGNCYLIPIYFGDVVCYAYFFFAVWWHPDTVHSVETQHGGEEPNGVFYTGFGPDCRINRNYLRHMRHSFLLGSSPPDFPENNLEEDFTGRATVDDLNDLGRELTGFPPSADSLQETSDKDKCL